MSSSAKPPVVRVVVFGSFSKGTSQHSPSTRKQADTRASGAASPVRPQAERPPQVAATVVSQASLEGALLHQRVRVESPTALLFAYDDVLNPDTERLFH